MYHRYFEDCEVKSEFKKEFVSLWPGWLGQENLHKLNEVTESEWQRFNQLIILLSQRYLLEKADRDKEKLVAVIDVSAALPSFEEALNKDASQFSMFVITELDCVITEEWDYTYIIWYQDERAITELSPLIKAVKLCHFS